MSPADTERRKRRCNPHSHQPPAAHLCRAPQPRASCPQGRLRAVAACSSAPRKATDGVSVGGAPSRAQGGFAGSRTRSKKPPPSLTHAPAQRGPTEGTGAEAAPLPAQPRFGLAAPAALPPPFPPFRHVLEGKGKPHLPAVTAANSPAQGRCVPASVNSLMRLPGNFPICVPGRWLPHQSPNALPPRSRPRALTLLRQELFISEITSM